MNKTYVRACTSCGKERKCHPNKIKDPSWDGLCHRCSGASLLKKQFPTGALIGEWVVEGYTFNRHNLVLVRCSCGNTSELSAATANSPRSKRCTSCSYKKISEDMSCGDLHRTYYQQIQAAATRRNIFFAINIEDMWNQYQKQVGRCAFTGLDLTLTNSNNFKQQTASLDRIDSKKGYTTDNIQWVHKDVNKMKMDLQEEDFFRIVKEIYEYKQLNK
jgi:hypothetical protein